MFIQISKQNGELPFLTRCTRQQKQDYVSLSLQMEKMATKIENDPKLMERAISKGLAEPIKNYAGMHRQTEYMKSRSRSHDRGRGMSFF